MIISKRSIRNTGKYLPTLKIGQIYKVGVQVTDDQKEILINLGFPDKLENGFCLIPKPVGRTTHFNVKEISKPELPKVSKSIMVYTSWKDWHGRPHSGIVNRSIKVNQTDLIIPSSEYLHIAQVNGSTYLTSAELINDTS